MKFSVSIFAEGDRIITLEEVVELADAVAISLRIWDISDRYSSLSC